MTWLFWLILAVVLTAVAAITGLQPKGGRPVAHTHMMGVGRFVLAILVIIVAYAAYRSYAGG
ncbi:MAG: hypothetical protein Q7J25_04575 [Vicinamibacterales bacterium]|nr:hypothetical protein [Vicinamibacterales bacterium]